MFSSFSAYLFGSGKDGDDCGKENEFTTVEADGDWLLVEKHKLGSVLNSEECGTHQQQPLKASDHNLPANGALTTCCVTALAIARPLQPAAGPALPSSPTPLAHLDGSWYITPPSCFTAGPPFNVHTSPLENLLIEHPSMSVYASVNGPSGESQHELAHAPERSRLEQALETSGRAARRSSRHRQPPSLVCKAGLLEQIQNQADVQKVKQRQEAKFLHGKQLERRNKAQEFQSAGKRHRRKDFMKTPSGKSNNRKY